MVSWCRDGCCHQQFASLLRRYPGRYQILVKYQVDITHVVNPQGKEPKNQTATNYSVPQPQNLTEAGGLQEVQNQPRLCSEFRARLGYTESCLQPSALKASLDPLPSLYSRCQDCPETRDSKEDPNRRRLTPSASIFLFGTCNPLQNLGLPWLLHSLVRRAGLLRLAATHREAG